MFANLKAFFALPYNVAKIVALLRRIAHALEFLADRSHSGYFRREQ